MSLESEFWRTEYNKLREEYRALQREKVLHYAVKTLNPTNGAFMVFTAQRRFPKQSVRSMAKEIQAWCTKLNIEIAPWFICLEMGQTLEMVPRATLQEILSETE